MLLSIAIALLMLTGPPGDEKTRRHERAPPAGNDRRQPFTLALRAGRGTASLQRAQRARNPGRDPATTNALPAARQHAGGE